MRGQPMASPWRSALWLDIVYIALYASGLAAACTLIARHGPGGWARWGRRLTPLPLVAALLDVIENVNLLLVVQRAGAGAELKPLHLPRDPLRHGEVCPHRCNPGIPPAIRARWVWQRLRSAG